MIIYTSTSFVLFRNTRLALIFNRRFLTSFVPFSLISFDLSRIVSFTRRIRKWQSISSTRNHKGIMQIRVLRITYPAWQMRLHHPSLKIVPLSGTANQPLSKLKLLPPKIVPVSSMLYFSPSTPQFYQPQFASQRPHTYPPCTHTQQHTSHPTPLLARMPISQT